MPIVTAASVADAVTPDTAFAGRQVLVSGGSRGLGAALTGAFATRGATVWSLHARSRDRMADLCAEFGRDRVRALACDLLDPADVAGAIASLGAERVALDGVVLCAAPPLASLGTRPEAVPAITSFVDRSLTMSLNLLTAARPLAREDGWIVLVSTAALTSPPAGWGHYVAAKAALEHYVAYFGHQHRLRTAVLRAPKMHTDLVNGPTAAIGAITVERVAGAVVRWVGEGAGDRELTVLDGVADEWMAGAPAAD